MLFMVFFSPFVPT